MKERKFESKVIEFLMILMFSFGIVITLFSLISIELNVYDIKLYFMIFITLVIFYKPFRTSSFRFIFYLINRTLHLIKTVHTDNDLLQKELIQLNNLPETEYIHLLKKLFEKHRYVALITKDIETFNVDLILWKGTRKYIVQIIKGANAVDIRKVQQVAVNIKTYSADGAMIITNQSFTPSAKKFSSLNHILLIDHDELINMMQDENKKFVFQTALFLSQHK